MCQRGGELHGQHTNPVLTVYFAIFNWTMGTTIMCRRSKCPSTENLPIWPSPFFIFFLKFSLLTTFSWQYHQNEIWHRINTCAKVISFFRLKNNYYMHNIKCMSIPIAVSSYRAILKSGLAEFWNFNFVKTSLMILKCILKIIFRNFHFSQW